MGGKYRECLPSEEMASHEALGSLRAVGKLGLKAETKLLGSRAGSCQLLGLSHGKLSRDSLRNGPPWLTQPLGIPLYGVLESQHVWCWSLPIVSCFGDSSPAYKQATSEKLPELPLCFPRLLHRQAAPPKFKVR